MIFIDGLGVLLTKSMAAASEKCEKLFLEMKKWVPLLSSVQYHSLGVGVLIHFTSSVSKFIAPVSRLRFSFCQVAPEVGINTPDLRPRTEASELSFNTFTW